MCTSFDIFCKPNAWFENLYYVNETEALSVREALSLIKGRELNNVNVEKLSSSSTLYMVVLILK